MKYTLSFVLLLAFKIPLFSQISKNDRLRLIEIEKSRKAYVNGRDTIKTQPALIKDSISIASIKSKIIPRVATVKSAILPGSGQVYNKTMWKVPLIYGGFAVTGYYIVRWNKYYEAFKTAYFDLSKNNEMYAKDPTKYKQFTKMPVTLSGVTTEFTEDRLREYTNVTRKNRDGSWLIIPVVWALNILDANITAHLKSFDLTDDISFKAQPNVLQDSFGNQAFGGKVVLAFK
jgi:hypothetical protein